MVKGIGSQGIGSRPGVGRKAIASRFGGKEATSPADFPAGTWSFVPPQTGYWKFVLRGCGGAGSSGSGAGASGAYCEVTRYLTTAQSVAIVVGTAFGPDTTATFPDGKVVTAGRASLAVAGVASGGDVNINGTPGVGTGNLNGNPGGGTGGGLGGVAGVGAGSGGAGAPANLPFHGASGASVAIPGAGAGGAEIGSVSNPGQGWAVAVFVKD
jgi:hypothetical protein